MMKSQTVPAKCCSGVIRKYNVAYNELQMHTFLLAFSSLSSTLLFYCHQYREPEAHFTNFTVFKKQQKLIRAKK